MKERERRQEETAKKHTQQKGSQMLPLFSERIGKNIQNEGRNKNTVT